MVRSTDMSRLLAAAGNEKSNLWDVTINVAILVGAILLIAVFVHWYRSRLRKTQEDGPAFTLQDLRELRDRGELDLSEYERLRALVLADVRGQTEKDSSH